MNIIRESMEVVDCDGQHVGTVKRLYGDCIELVAAGSGDGRSHFIKASLVQNLRGNSITLTGTAAQALGMSEPSWNDRPATADRDD